jgi:peptidoglycan/xylan/chitin deacetylase (PgdA/CDA1 family)
VGLGPCTAAPKTHVLITIDVESFGAGSPQTEIWGDLVGETERWGITRIMDILEEQESKGTFYLNVYEVAKHGDQPLRTAAEAIVARGHDLQLHTHPGSMFPARGLANASFEDQVRILQTGLNLLEEWSGQQAIAHRAGAYKANSDSLRALAAVGLPVDSSLSVASRSPLARAGYTRNAIQTIDGIVEFPVTYYEQLRFGDWSSRRIVDIEASTLRELKAILDQATNAGLCSVNIMMHSFSLSRKGVPDPRIADRLRRFLSYVDENPDAEAVTTSELYRRIRENDACASERDLVPYTGPVLTYLRAVEDFDRGSTNKVVAIGGIVSVLLAIGGLFAAVRFSSRWFTNRKAGFVGTGR